jgi:hypothetical protein
MDIPWRAWDALRCIRLGYGERSRGRARPRGNLSMIPAAAFWSWRDSRWCGPATYARITWPVPIPRNTPATLRLQSSQARGQELGCVNWARLRLYENGLKKRPFQGNHLQQTAIAH